MRTTIAYSSGPLLRNHNLGQIEEGDLIVPWGLPIFKNPQRTMYFFPASIDTMAETTSCTIECLETVQKWKYSNSIAVDKNL